MPHFAIVGNTQNIYMYTILQLACMYLQASMVDTVLFPCTCTSCSKPSSQPQIYWQALVDVINIGWQSSTWSDAGTYLTKTGRHMAISRRSRPPHLMLLRILQMSLVRAVSNLYALNLWKLYVP